MTYETVFLNTFLKQFKKLPTDARERAKQRVQQLAENPYLGLRHRGRLEGFRKDRTGDYRMIFKIDEQGKRLIFYDVNLRKKIYE